MKIFTGAQIHELDQYTIEHEPIKSIDLMERAAKAITHAITEEWSDTTPIVVFAGSGNNGGDALAVARLLIAEGYKVKVVLFNISNHLSEDCTTNKNRLLQTKHFNDFTEVKVSFDPPELTADTLVIDGLFGTGLKKSLAGGFASLVKYINQSPSKVVSIDMPSGLLAEDNSCNVRANIIQADLTLTLHQKKLAFLLGESQHFLGRVKVLDIRLSEEFIEKTNAHYLTLDEADVRKKLLPRNDFAHKGTMGIALLVAGSYGMAGAAILATRACLRAGVGKVIVHTPRRNYDIMQTAVPEAVMQMDYEETCFSEAVDMEDIDALGIGPGLGQQENTAIAMISQLRRARCPIVADADALNMLASHRAWMQQLPKGIIMTPHAAEFDRLNGTPSNSDYERLEKAQNMAQTANAYIILKGHNSALCLPNGNILFNTTGNSGMATAGSGDVLTGIITAFLARGYHQEDAAALGMYIHGLAGDLAAKDLGKESLIASDIIDYLPDAFKRLKD